VKRESAAPKEPRPADIPAREATHSFARRRAAALRLEPLADGRRDPLFDREVIASVPPNETYDPYCCAGLSLAQLKYLAGAYGGCPRCLGAAS
jgi:hypothetical protein